MNAMEPPRWAERLLRVSLSLRDYEVVSGDLLEDFNEAVVAGVLRQSTFVK